MVHAVSVKTPRTIGSYKSKNPFVPMKGKVIFSMDLDDTLAYYPPIPHPFGKGHVVGYDKKGLKLLEKAIQKIADKTDTEIVPIVVTNATYRHAHRTLNAIAQINELFKIPRHSAEQKIKFPIFARDSVAQGRVMSKKHPAYPRNLIKKMKRQNIIQHMNDLVGWIHIGDDEHFTRRKNHFPDKKFTQNMGKYFKEKNHPIPTFFGKLGFLDQSEIPAKMHFACTHPSSFDFFMGEFTTASVRQLEKM